ncbi:hypothetical protein GALMADRAFT_1033042 [Galerina marginata CBS 339.88]|uniref:F-box domain-containing protein n=1 Tax=Galerina marginata (strain CBS 339.88) TaxID=685588 RepID=A0A067SC56_GALM3|nr:hypothetical protein GALMADRAFT_1033042 [Galerina marginata CBS 339.88]
MKSSQEADSVWNKLPAELWFVVAENARREDLPFFARVSTLFCLASRQPLYRRVSLRTSDSFKATFDLFKDPRFSECVETLELDYLYPTTEVPLSEFPSLISGMSNLRSIKIRNCYLFASAPEHALFFQTVKSSCPLLTEFEYAEPSSIEFTDFSLKNIKNLVWYGYYGHIIEPAMSLFVASLASLTRISLRTEYTIDPLTIIPFCSLNFPWLTFLELPPWAGGGRDFPEAQAALTRFLIAHGSITDLELAYCGSEEFPSSVELDPDLITIDILPNLRSLNARATVVSMMAMRGCKCLKFLTSLATGCASSAEARDGFDIFIESLGNSNSLLKHLSFHPGQEFSNNYDNFDEWLDLLSKAFRDVEAFNCEIAQGITIRTFFAFLSKFRNLRNLHVLWYGHSADYTLNRMLEIAEPSCPRLEKIYCEGSAGETRVIQISRDHAAGTSVSTQLVENNELELPFGRHSRYMISRSSLQPH